MAQAKGESPNHLIMLHPVLFKPELLTHYNELVPYHILPLILDIKKCSYQNKVFLAKERQERYRWIFLSSIYDQIMILQNRKNCKN